MALARLLFPGFRAVRSRLIHPVARTLYNLYADHLDMAALEDIKDEPIEALLVVDTRSRARIKEFLQLVSLLPPTIDVWDHHPDDSSDIPGAILHELPVGANTTLLGLEAMKRGLRLSVPDATIALAGIYADTGNFTHENTCSADFQVAGWLLEQGASLTLTRSFLQTLKDESQITLFHEILNRLVYQTIHGHLILTVYVEMERQAGGLAAVVEKVFDVEQPDAMFAVFAFTHENSTLIVARSQNRSIDVAALCRAFGGGGHAQASSALCKGATGRATYHALQATLKAGLGDAASAASLMAREVVSIQDGWSLQDAALFLEKSDRSGVPVTDLSGRMCGYLTLRDIMKARKADQMSAPVRSHMRQKVVTGTPTTSLREIESLFSSHTIFDLPILEDGRIVGTVTRDAYLKARVGK